MARSRIIKPGYFTNDVLMEADPLARLLFAGLWCLADREGRLLDRPTKIKVEILPADNCDLPALLEELHRKGFIQRYEVDGQGYIQIVNWNKHQSVHPKEKASDIPPPPCMTSKTGNFPNLPPMHEPCIESKPCNSTATPPMHDTQAVKIHDNGPPSTSYSTSTSYTHSDASASGCVSVNGLKKEPDENQTLAQEGMLYLNSLNSPNHTNTGWVKGYLGVQFPKLEQNRPDIPKPEILAIWRDTCDLAVAKNATSPEWFKTTFNNKLDAWTPSTAKTFVPDPVSGESSAERTRALLEFPVIRHRHTGEIFYSENLQVLQEAPNGLTDQRGNYYPVLHLEGVTEAPSPDGRD